MNFLLDTHVFLWMLAAPDRLSREAYEVIRSPGRAVFVSAVSAVEISIKQGLGKLEAPDQLSLQIAKRGLLELVFRFNHGERLGKLPRVHSDPFDRMLIAQAIEEDLTIITRDRKFEGYPVRIVWT